MSAEAHEHEGATKIIATSSTITFDLHKIVMKKLEGLLDGREIIGLHELANAGIIRAELSKPMLTGRDCKKRVTLQLEDFPSSSDESFDGIRRLAHHNILSYMDRFDCRIHNKLLKVIIQEDVDGELSDYISLMEEGLRRSKSILHEHIQDIVRGFVEGFLYAHSHNVLIGELKQVYYRLCFPHILSTRQSPFVKLKCLLRAPTGGLRYAKANDLRYLASKLKSLLPSGCTTFVGHAELQHLCAEIEKKASRREELDKKILSHLFFWSTARALFIVNICENLKELQEEVPKTFAVLKSNYKEIVPDTPNGRWMDKFPDLVNLMNWKRREYMIEKGKKKWKEDNPEKQITDTDVANIRNKVWNDPKSRYRNSVVEYLKLIRNCMRHINEDNSKIIGKTIFSVEAYFTKQQPKTVMTLYVIFSHRDYEKFNLLGKDQKGAEEKNLSGNRVR